VAAGHPATTEAAVAVLEAGGNAVDAALAAGFAATIAEPGLTSLGGGGFLLARDPDGAATLLDFFADNPGRGSATHAEPHFVPVTIRFPGADQVFNAGLGSAATPGVLAGLLMAHAQLGRVPLEVVLEPAIGLAREGVVVSPLQGYFLALLEPILTLTAGGRRLFASAGRYPQEGDRLANPDLASFLEELPRDRGRDLYEGALGEQVARDMRDGDGLLTAADLSGYRVRARAPLEVPYRGFALLTNPPPSSGGTLIGLSLQRLAVGAPAGRDPTDGAELLRRARVMRDVEALRQADPLPGQRAFSRGTTHVSVRDAAGGVASMTTSNGEGSGYVIPGTGILLNNMMGEDDLHPGGFFAGTPGERIGSMMSPSLLLREGEVDLVLGSGGSKRIRTALLQVILDRIDFRLPIEVAVSRPRLHWDGLQLQAEPGLPARSLRLLEDEFLVNEWPRRDVYFGGVHAVAAGEAGADARRGGFATVL